jgi:methylmalonyl-CoA mutase cobalamin-binding subunit
MTLNKKRQFKKYLYQWLEQSSTHHNSREFLINSKKAIEQFMIVNAMDGLWTKSPVLLTATLDDALGQGLDIIESFSIILGITIKRIGLMREPETIISICQKEEPDYLGMTVLQFDSENELQRISKEIPEKTCFIAGGPLFQRDANFARKCGIHETFKNVGEYIFFVLNHCVE